MPIEKSILSQDDLLKLMKEHYGIVDVLDIHNLEQGTANCHKITTKHKKYFLKEFQSKYSTEDMEIEPSMVNFLASKDFPVASFIKTKLNRYTWEYCGKTFHMQHFIDGQCYQQKDTPEWLLTEAAKCLGQIQKLLKDFPQLKSDFPKKWFTSWSEEGGIIACNSLLKLVESVSNSKIKGKITTDLKYKLNLISRVAKINIEYDKLTVRNSHGDFNILQILCGESKVNAVIDFSTASSLPVVWEVIRSFTLSDKNSISAQINIDRFKKYIIDYLEAGGELSRYDISIMPKFYLLQLARNHFGYKEYLTSIASENVNIDFLNDLLHFGYWRTDMCRWLETNGDDLTLELQSIL
ncbi:MAG: hypothetical protein A2381_13455 [Bdellovibrionales bacterium RIFOXYB1_FULL_37_110]|nr:MAG: hypothetical protein A2417_08115 [Bdellovibrionales bacterium RIFOXYC1_FULL_37_79]OFZ59452.1 MAG: hypothetical protein A2381_13455 [Bdellovibrionales bacterium RIFOXYB1_FULL_37_110]OFZ64299.1 MAG: hypothetical protein A2577_02580 [Bdellovibrionales bacterium RIFOXYD1_FULL_36_51]